MTRKTGFATSFLSALIVALVPALPVQGGVTPAAPIDDAVEAGAPSDAALSSVLVRAGMPLEETHSFVAGLDASERALVAEKAPEAQAGGLVFLVPLIPFLIAAAIALGLVGTGAAVKHATETPKDAHEEPASDARAPVANQ